MLQFMGAFIKKINYNNKGITRIDTSKTNYVGFMKYLLK